MELIYHEFNDSKSSKSPFHRIEQVVKEESIDIVCPYLSLDVIERIAELADSWRLITDSSEWVQTQSNHEEIQEFIRRNRNQIHDCSSLHAKVILTENSAIIGSANFTRTGLRENTELSVLLKQKSQIRELHNWVNELWNRTYPVDEDALSDFADNAEPIDNRSRDRTSMPETGPTYNTSLDFLNPKISVEKSGHQRLVERVSEAPDREWINTYFDLMAEVIEITGIDEDDTQIATTVPKSNSRLPVIINQRYVLTAFLEKGKVGFMLPSDSNTVDTFSEYISDFGAFSTSSDNDPYWLEFPGNPNEYLTNQFKDDWKSAIKKEQQRGSHSTHRQWHQSSSYKTAINTTYRGEVLQEAFKDG